MNYKEMTVKELREESRKRGLTLEYKGHKFTKSELIERLKNCDCEVKEEAEKEVEVKEEVEMKEVNQEVIETEDDWNTLEVEETNKNENKTEWETETNKNENKIIVFAETLEEIEKKYSIPKPEYIFETILKVGSFVVFIHYVEVKYIPGKIVKKLRTAKVIGVNRKKRIVRVQTFYGEVMELTFEDLLFIKEDTKESFYPADIKKYMKKQRTEKGQRAIDEKFGNVKN